jgi:hypothetical protein
MFGQYSISYRIIVPEEKKYTPPYQKAGFSFQERWEPK